MNVTPPREVMGHDSSSEPAHEGTVVRAVSNFYDVLPDNPTLVVGLDASTFVRCRAGNRLRKELVMTESTARPQRVREVRRLNTMEPVAIGDRVRFHVTQSSGRAIPEGLIEEVLPRHRVLARQAVTTGSIAVGQVLVANLDQVLITFAATSPDPSLGMFDRFLVSCESRDLPAAIVINKVDLGISEDLAVGIRAFETAGYRVLRVSAATGEGMDELLEMARGKISTFVGPSGVGKSTLLNALQPGLGLRVGNISTYTNKGTHTTRYAQLVPLTFGGFLADTPGTAAVGALGGGSRRDGPLLSGVPAVFGAVPVRELCPRGRHRLRHPRRR